MSEATCICVVGGTTNMYVSWLPICMFAPEPTNILHGMRDISTHSLRADWAHTVPNRVQPELHSEQTRFFPAAHVLQLGTMQSGLVGRWGVAFLLETQV